MGPAGADKKVADKKGRLKKFQGNLAFTRPKEV